MARYSMVIPYASIRHKSAENPAQKALAKDEPEVDLPAFPNIAATGHFRLGPLAAGSYHVKVTPNGAGKTTTIAMISGLIAPTAGDAWIGGHSITKEPLAAKRLIGFIPQEIALYPELSARQNLRFFGQLYGLRGKELRQGVAVRS